MKAKLLIPAAIVFCIFFAASSAMAGPIVVGDWVKITAFNGINGGGIITLAISHAQPPPIVSGGSYDTFCSEMLTGISAGPWYEVAGVVPVTDPNAAFLFDRFNHGDPQFSGLDGATQVQLQEAIWMYLGFLTVDPGNPFVAIAEAANPVGTFDVVSLDLKSARGLDVQNMLYQTSVPEPSILLLLGLGISAVGLASRKK